MLTPTWKTVLAASILGASASQGAIIHATRQSNTSTILWNECPDVPSTQCAFFSVPMDYTNPDGNETVSIFLRKYPATVPEDQRLGSLLTNPGGPGGSGSQFVAVAGRLMSDLTGGRYDVIGFDSRAVNLTGPSTSCYDAEAKYMNELYQEGLHGVPFPRHDKSHVAKLAALQATQNAACKQNGDHLMLRNSGTVAVVKDMERIVQVLGDDGLNFLGYSYGSILGATFAALRPNLVKRMVLDGISDSESYFNDVLQWGRDSLQDTHITLAGFASTCIEAGPEYCALASKSRTAQGILDRLDALYARLDKEPLVIGDSPNGPMVIEAHYVQGYVFVSLYSPSSWGEVANVLAHLEQGDGSALLSATASYDQIAFVPKPYDQNVFNRSMQTMQTRESFNPIICGDSASLNITIDQYTDYFQEMGKISSIGEQFATITGRCRGWSFRANERFPILFVSLDGDPVTPLASAVKMSKAFGDSASLLVQQGFGHASLAHPSLCTAKHIQEYFINGTVPRNGTRCTPEPGFIYPSNATNTKRAVLSERDAQLLISIEKMGQMRSKLMT
ncbi:unnamed protein product [Rhizoctonia solani]|uniref:Hydrolase Mb2248c n=1 Tax=Rhizoctonia solani TaxID=456999 RepID=A0A8H3D1D4_9AGAM|nr:unnamed protein product [Rhizoctonia solani]